MAIAKYSREYKVNMGNYEHVVFGLDIMANTDEPDYQGLSTAELTSLLKAQVEDALKDDIVAAHEDTEKDDSFIHLHPFNQ